MILPSEGFQYFATNCRVKPTNLASKLTQDPCLRRDDDEVIVKGGEYPTVYIFTSDYGSGTK